MIGLSKRAAGTTREPGVSDDPRSRSGQLSGQTGMRLAVFVLAVIFLVYAYSIFFVPQQRPDEPLMVTLRDDSGDTRLLDTVFTEDYDYSSLWDKGVLFNDFTRSSDYSPTFEMVTIEMEFETAREIDWYLGNQSIPNVVRGFAMYYLDQYINMSVNPEEFEEILGGKGFGGFFNTDVNYDVSSERGLGTYNGIYVSKIFRRNTIFEIRIDAGEIISNILTGYPDNPVFKVAHWKSPRR